MISQPWFIIVPAIPAAILVEVKVTLSMVLFLPRILVDLYLLWYLGIRGQKASRFRMI